MERKEDKDIEDLKRRIEILELKRRIAYLEAEIKNIGNRQGDMLTLCGNSDK